MAGLRYTWRMFTVALLSWSLLGQVQAVAPAEWEHDCGLEQPGAVIAPVPSKAFEPQVIPGEPPRVRRELSTATRLASVPSARLTAGGALSGKTVYVSAGHGFYWAPAVNGWRTQRGASNEVVEDFITIETVDQFLIPMLLNAGARVVTLRESDLNSSMVIVDNAGAGYQENGSGFSDSSLAGWAPPPSPLQTGTNPFALGSNRIMAAGATATAFATFTATVPADGAYQVYVAYTSATARATDAHYVVVHAGGETHFRVNQQRGGGTWVLLGRFYFKKAQPGVVKVLADSQNTQSPLNVSLDAVRFGGGMSTISRGNGATGRPRFEESARYYTQYAGAPTSVYDARDSDFDDDVVARSRFAAWDHDPGEDAAYVALHTNAVNGTASGTETYVYGPNAPGGAYQFTGAVNSDKLASFVQNEIINDIRSSAGWNKPAWPDRGRRSAYFGELNPSHNNEMPAILVELAFHDNVGDSAALKDPAFRYLSARAIAQGLIRYFNSKDGVSPVYPPEPPTHVAAVVQGNAVELSWRAPAVDGQGVAGMAATSYRVYSSRDGLAWDNGVEAQGTKFSTTVSGSGAQFFRVAAVNDGGESLPSDVVGARPGGGGRVLVVNAYDRFDATLNKKEDLSRFSLGNVQRSFIERMNDGAAVVRHGDALDFANIGFDSVSSAALVAGVVMPAGYRAIDFIAGRGHAGGAALSAAEQSALSGAKLFISGNSLARTLSGQPFLAQTLKASGAATSTSLSLTSAAVPFDDMGTFALGDGASGSYWAGTNDVLTPSGSTAIAEYAAGQTAGVAANNTLVYLGFPYETVATRAQRLEVMGRVMKYLDVIGSVPVVPDGGEPEPDPDPLDPDGGVGAQGPVTLELLQDTYPGVTGQGCGCSANDTGSMVGWAGFALAAMGIRRIGKRRHANQTRD